MKYVICWEDPKQGRWFWAMDGPSKEKVLLFKTVEEAQRFLGDDLHHLSQPMMITLDEARVWKTMES